MKARENPFRVQRVLELRYRLEEAEWGELLWQLESRGYRGALVGHEGSGKTTLLEDLAERLTNRGLPVRWLRLSRDLRPGWNVLCQNLVTTYRSSDTILLDGAEQIPWWGWRRFLRQTESARGLVITSHHRGRLATLRHCQTSLELTETLVEQLVGPLSSTGKLRLARLYRLHRGNVRDILRALYDYYAKDASVSHHFQRSRERFHRDVDGCVEMA